MSKRVEIYYAVPTHYTIGPTFETYEEARAEAERRAFDSSSTEYVDRRIKVTYADGSVCDSVDQRFEIEPDNPNDEFDPTDDTDFYPNWEWEGE